MNVSRKTVTIWKTEGRIAIDGEKVDAERSREVLRQYSSSRSTGYQAATSGGKVTSASFHHDLSSATVTALAKSLSRWPEGYCDEMAVLLLPLLPEAGGKAALCRAAPKWLLAMADVLDEHFGALASIASRRQHPDFKKPASPIWEDLHREAVFLAKEVLPTRK